MTRPLLRILFFVTLGFLMSKTYLYIEERLQIAKDTRERCGQYDRQDRKHCLIIRQVL